MNGFNEFNGKVRVRVFRIASFVVFVLVAISLDCAVVKIMKGFTIPSVYKDPIIELCLFFVEIVFRLIAVFLWFRFWRAGSRVLIHESEIKNNKGDGSE